MDRYVVSDFAFTLSIETLAQRLRLENDPNDEDFQRVSEMLAEALACARPKFAYRVAAIEEKGEDYVIVEGHRLDSPLVRKNLDKVHRIVPYVATCGLEVDAWSRTITDRVEHFWADEIKNQILRAAIAELRSTVQRRYFPDSPAAGDAVNPALLDEHGDPAGSSLNTAQTDGSAGSVPVGGSAGSGRGADMAKMSPGSLPEWPVSQQPALFALLEGLPAEIGVRLTDSCLMLPSKSVSGFFFSSETHFVNCRFCPILSCPNRSAEYLPAAGPAQ